VIFFSPWNVVTKHRTNLHIFSMVRFKFSSLYMASMKIHSGLMYTMKYILQKRKVSQKV
jgi:hypothetical protein